MSVFRCCRRSCRRKLLTFLSFSPEPLGRFQPNLAQSTLEVKGIHICSNDDPHLFPRGDNNEIAKFHLRNFKNIPLQNHSVNFIQTWRKASLGKGDSSLFK